MTPSPSLPRKRESRELDAVPDSWTPAFAGVTGHSWPPAFAKVTGSSWLTAPSGVTGQSWTPAFAKVTGSSWTPAFAGVTGPRLLALFLLLAAPRILAAASPLPLTFPVAREDHVVTAECTGHVVAEVEEDVVVPPGLEMPTIESLLEQGTIVKKGDVVVQLSTFDVDRQVREARNELAEKRAELDKKRREDANLVAEAEDRLRQRTRNLAGATRILAMREGEPDALELERLELKIRADGIEIGDLERKAATQAALEERGFASALQASQARGALARKKMELAKNENLLAHVRSGYREEEVEQQRRLVERWQAELTLAGKDLEELRKIVTLEQEKKALEIRAKEAALAEKERARDSASLLAPMDGAVIHKSSFFQAEPYEVGSRVWAGVAIATVARMEHPRAIVLVSEQAVAKVAKDMAAVLHVLAEPERSYRGKVALVSGVPKPREPTDATGAKDFEVTIVFEDAAPHLKPNLPVRASIRTAALEGVFPVPREVVSEDPETHALSVGKHTPGGRVQSAVEAADEDVDWYYLRTGVEQGDRLLYE